MAWRGLPSTFVWCDSRLRAAERDTLVCPTCGPGVDGSPTSKPSRASIIRASFRSWVLLLRCSSSIGDFSGFLILEPTPECYGTWFESDQLPWSDTPSGAYVARPTPVKCVTHAETPHWGGGEVRRKAPVSAIDRVCGTTAGAVVPQPVPVGSGSSTVRRHRARPAPIAGRCGRIAFGMLCPPSTIPAPSTGRADGTRPAAGRSLCRTGPEPGRG
jgi:hypothetical protein